MNQILKKFSYVSGAILLFLPLYFSALLRFVLGFQIFLYSFDPAALILYIAIFIIAILQLFYFIKIFKVYRSRDSHAYFIIYYMGVLAVILLFGTALFSPPGPLVTNFAPGMGLISATSWIVQFVYLFQWLLLLIAIICLISFRQQKEKFIVGDSSSSARKNVIILFAIGIVITVISYFIDLNFLSGNQLLLYPLLSAIIALCILPWWRKKTNMKSLRDFLFVPSFIAIFSYLLGRLSVYYALYTVFKFIFAHS